MKYFIYLIFALLQIFQIKAISQTCPTTTSPACLDSGGLLTCHNNTNANSEYPGKYWPSKSVVSFRINGCRACTGFLIRSTANPGMPYIISAKHCLLGTSNGCSVNYDGTNDDICFDFEQGAVQRCFEIRKIYESNDLDVMVLQLATKLPYDRDYFYAGYDLLYSDLERVYSFYHPIGRQKRFSFGDIIDYCEWQAGNIGNNAIHVAGWNCIPHRGASGSPLFERYNNRVIGVQSKGDLCKTLHANLGEITQLSLRGNPIEMKTFEELFGNNKIVDGTDFTPQIVIDNSSLLNCYDFDDVIKFDFYPSEQQQITIELEGPSCGVNGNNLVESNVITQVNSGDNIGNTTFLANTIKTISLKKISDLQNCTPGTYRIKIYDSINFSDAVFSKQFTVKQSATCFSSSTLNHNQKKSLLNSNDFEVYSLCSANDYDIEIISNYNGSFNFMAQVFSGSTLLSTTTNINENTNFPYVLYNNANSDLIVVLTGNTDTYCFQDQLVFTLNDCPGNNDICISPTNLSSNINGNQALMSWNSVPEAVNYDIQYSTNGVINNNGGSNGYTTTSISANFSSCNTHYFRVRSNCLTGSSPFSSWYSFYVSDGTSNNCATPSLAIAENGNYVQTNWNNVSGETEYELQHRINGGPWSSVSMPANSNSNLYPADDCTDYDTRIRTICDCVSSSWSTIASVTTSGCSTGPTCSDGIQNGNESGVDCGGSCPSCPSNTCNTLTITWPDPFDCGQQIALVTSENYIRWAPFNCNSGLVDIEYSINGGNSWITQAINEPDDGIYTFNVTQNHVSNQFRVRINCTDNSYCGETCNYKIIGDSVFGCSDPAAHNYDPLVTQDNGTCETCNDGLLNGDEGGIDCGGANPACTPCNPGNDIQFDNNTCTGVYAWDDDIIITWDPGTNLCGRVFFYASADGGQTWEQFFNLASGILNTGDVDFQAISRTMTGDLIFKLVCVDNPSNYTITSCTTTVTTCGSAPPNNDNPCGATTLQVSSNDNCNYTTFSNCNSFLSNVGDQGCGGTLTYDNWFKFTVPNSGKVNIETFSSEVAWNQYVLYSGTCSNLVVYECAPSNNSTSSEGSFENLPVGATMYIQFYTVDKFPESSQICVYEPEICSGESLLFPPNVNLDCASLINDLSITGDVLGESILCPTCNEASYSDTNNFTYCDGGTINRVWTFTDECGTTYTHNQVITIQPDFTVIDFDLPSDIVIGCDDDIHNVSLTGSPTNLTGTCGPSTLNYEDNYDNLDYCSNTGQIIRFWHIEDDQCGFRKIKIQNIYLTDNGCFSKRCKGETCSTAEELSYNGTYFCDGPSFGNSANANDATHADWYYFTPEEDGFVSINTCFNNVDTRLYFSEGACYNVIANNDDFCPLSNGGQPYASSIQNIPVVCGQTYYLEWDSRWSQEQFLFDFQFEGCSTPVNGEGFYEDFEGSWIDNFEHVCTDDLNWIHTGSGTPSDNTGPTEAFNGALYLYLEASGSNHPNKVASITSSCFDLGGMTDPALWFLSHMWGSCMGDLIVEIRNVPGGNWTTILFKTGNQGNRWDADIIRLHEYVNQTVQFRITGITGSCFESDIAIDGFWIYDYCQTNRNVGGNIYLGADLYYVEADQQITMDGKLNTGDMILDAGNNILFIPGAEIVQGATVHAYIDGCDSDPNARFSND